jgi:hypothetical protein
VKASGETNSVWKKGEAFVSGHAAGTTKVLSANAGFSRSHFITGGRQPRTVSAMTKSRAVTGIFRRVWDKECGGIIGISGLNLVSDIPDSPSRFHA